MGGGREGSIRQKIGTRGGGKTGGGVVRVLLKTLAARTCYVCQEGKVEKGKDKK